MLLTLGMVYISVLFNQWNNAFFSALQDKNQAAFLGQLFRVSWLIAVFIFLAVYQLYLNQMLEIRWRRWLTDRYLRAWLADGAYYRMQLVARETDNPDQRIAEDLHLLASHTLGLFVGGLRAGVTLATFVAILWGLSGTLTVPVGGFSITLPGYMVWVAVLYAIAGTWLTDWIGRPLVRLNFDRQRYEADFRFSLVRFRENTEGVALYRGEADEFRGFRERFEEVVRNWWGIMRRQKRLTYFTSGYGQGAWIVPSVVAAPRYFRGELGLGGLMQTTGAFQQVQDALSFFVQSYKEIAAWSAVVERLAGFERALEHVHRAGGERRRRPARRGARHAPDRGGRRSLSSRWPAAHGERQPLALARRHRAPGRRVGLGEEHARPCHRRHLAVRARRDPRAAGRPGPLSAAAAVPADRHAPGRGELSDARGRVWTTRRCARRSRPWGSRSSPGGSTRHDTGRSSSPPASSSASPSRGPWSRSPTGSSSTRRPRRWTRRRRRASIGWCASGSPETTVFSIGHRATLRPFHARLLMVKLSGNGPASIVEMPDLARRWTGARCSQGPTRERRKPR